jgi:tetrahydromethanopterin S-methyltransferase subunit D
VAKSQDLPDVVYFVLGAVIGALLGGAAASLVDAALWVSVLTAVVGGVAFGFLGVAFREEILFLFLP